MQKTLGGDRLGSGKKMKVDLHGYERSTHNLGYIWRSTMSSGTLVPFLKQLALPGDTFDIDLDCDIKTHPTVGPLFGSYKVQLDVFFAPLRLYNSLLHNNMLGIGLDMSRVKLPIITFPVKPPADGLTDLSNTQVEPSSILAYMGTRGFGWTAVDTTRDIQVVPILAYWEIYKNYYANKQEEIGAVIHNTYDEPNDNVVSITINGTALVEYPASSAITNVTVGSPIIITYAGTPPNPADIYINIAGTGDIPLSNLSNNLVDDGVDTLEGTIQSIAGGLPYINAVVLYWRYRSASDQGSSIAPQVVYFELNNIDDMRKAILADPGTAPYNINTLGLPPYSYLAAEQNGLPNILSTQEGLAIKTYQSDLFNNWLQTEWIDGVDGISAVTAVDTSAGSFTIDTLNLSKKVYDMLNRIAVSGGSYDDWLDAVYAHDRYQRAESPMYMGGLIKELVFTEIVSNTQTEEQPLGTLAGKGVMSQKHKGGKIVVKADEPGYILGIISLTPRVDYSQGNDWDINLKTLNDIHKPALDEIGFQDLIVEKMAWWATAWDGVKWITQSAGKQPAWIDYMTNVNKTYGNFAKPDNEMFMTLNRRYEWGTGYSVTDLTTYIDPTKFNFIFADTSLDAQNFWAQIAIDITARRKMSAKLMPNL